MANKKTIHQLEHELDGYVRKLNHATRKITETRDLIKKIRMGKVKQPAPKGVRIDIPKPSWPAEFEDEIPSFGTAITGLE